MRSNIILKTAGINENRHMKKILVINGHPSKKSFNSRLFDNYIRGAKESSAEIRQVNVSDLPLENYLRYEHFSGTPVSKEITLAREDVVWADHIVFFHPVWWGGMPAILKCYIDIVFASGFAFKYQSGSSMPLKLLKGKSAHIFTTLDTPIFIYKYFFHAPSINQLKSRILAFCGISLTRVTYFGPIRSITLKNSEKFLNSVYIAGKNLL